MIRLCAHILLAASLLTVWGCPDPETGTEDNPFTMYFVPSKEADTIAHSADAITEYVQKYVSQKLYGNDDGFHVESSIPNSYIAVVEAFGTGRADFAAINTFSYVLAKDMKGYPVKPILAVVRGDGETHYKGQIIAHVDSDIDSVEDVTGKKFAFTDPASTAGFILPSHLFEENGIEPAETVFARAHDMVVTQVYQKAVDAGATYYSPPKDGKIRDARARVKTQYPDVEEKVKIVGFTMETPNEPWVIRTDIYDDPKKQKQLEELVREALFEFSKTDEGRKALEELYDITGVAPVEDDVYDGIRKLIKDSDVDLEKHLD